VRILEAGRLPAVERVTAGVVLAHVRDPRPGVGVREDGLPDIAWCEVPTGKFIMGSQDNDLAFFGAKETPQHQVSVPAFHMSRYPVTNAQFSAFVEAGGYHEKHYWTESGWRWRENEELDGAVEVGEPWNLPNHPVVAISWYEASAFCRWLSERLGYNVRLPSETEWEKAARGTDGRTYPWGEEIDPEKANYGDTGIGTTSAVGCFPAGTSPYGILDLSGNVWEWTRTGFQESYEDYQPNLPVKDSAVVRGGAFDDSVGVVRCTVRDWGYPYDRYDVFGFRVVCGSPRPSALER
jgi:formylglycine-generating enzyme required for sulfatase activity